MDILKFPALERRKSSSQQKQNNILKVSCEECENIKYYYQEERLGVLSSSIPDLGNVSLDLKVLYEEGIDPLLQQGIAMQDIASIVLYGEMLYEHFPPEMEQHSYGEWHTISQGKRHDIPKQIDVMVFTHNLIETYAYFCNNDRKECTLDASCKGGVFIFEKKYGDSFEHCTRDLPVHISYRSLLDFTHTKSLRNDAELSQVMTYGVPFIGKEHFYHATESLFKNVHLPLHAITLDTTYENCLNGLVI